MTKKISYKDKHQVVGQNKSLSSVWIEDNADLWAILQKPYDFEQGFLSLPYNRQIAMISTLNTLVKGKNLFSDKKTQRVISEYASFHLDTIHWMLGSLYEEGNAYFPIADDEKRLVRMECYGSINERRQHELSTCYKYFSNEADKKASKDKKIFRLKQYDMNSSPMWRVFRQFESFRSVENKVRRFMYNIQLNPDALKVMSVNDFCDVIYKMTAAEDRPRGMFLKKGYKNRFVMRFMKACGDDLFLHLKDKGIDERAAYSLCRAMRLYGICDIDSLVVTETHYTKKILENLQKHGYDVTNIKEGDVIPEEFTKMLFRRDEEDLILALDKDGQPLDKSNLPRYEVHHKNAVKFSAHNEYLARANYDENLMLVEHDMHQIYYHGFDRIEQVANNNERYFSRINIADETLCLIDGFNSSTDAFFSNLAQSSYMNKRRKEDEKYVVNYYEMALKRLNNVAIIAESYNIEYSKKNLATEKNQINEFLTTDMIIPAEDLKTFSKWIKEKQKSFGRIAKKRGGYGR